MSCFYKILDNHEVPSQLDVAKEMPGRTSTLPTRKKCLEDEKEGIRSTDVTVELQLCLAILVTTVEKNLENVYTLNFLKSSIPVLIVYIQGCIYCTFLSSKDMTLK